MGRRVGRPARTHVGVVDLRGVIVVLVFVVVRLAERLQYLIEDVLDERTSVRRLKHLAHSRYQPGAVEGVRAIAYVRYRDAFEAIPDLLEPLSFRTRC